jgi:hypothetical protein
VIAELRELLPKDDNDSVVETLAWLDAVPGRWSSQSLTGRIKCQSEAKISARSTFLCLATSRRMPLNVPSRRVL